jgi:uncharacterized protein YkwD
MFKRSQGRRRSSGGVLAPMTRRRLAYKHRKPRSRSKLMPVLLVVLGLATALSASLVAASALSAHSQRATLLSNWNGGKDPSGGQWGSWGDGTGPQTPAPTASSTASGNSGSADPGPSASADPSPEPTPSQSTPSASQSAASQVLAVVNQARAAAGLPAYTESPALDSTAAAHDALMAAGCGLSHQCPGEPPIGNRETAAGVQWTAAGENIAVAGPIPDTASAIAQEAVALTQSMLNETAPNDGHRLNMLSSTYTEIGIAVIGNGSVWLTQDFAN